MKLPISKKLKRTKKRSLRRRAAKHEKLPKVYTVYKHGTDITPGKHYNLLKGECIRDDANYKINIRKPGGGNCTHLDGKAEWEWAK